MSSWDCPKCNEVNPESRKTCRDCGYNRFQYHRKLTPQEVARNVNL
jgi:ribosomal protein L40E